MQISITGNKLDIGESLTAHIEDALEVIVSKYFGSAIDGSVVVSREGPQFRADITVHIGRGIQVRSRDTADDGYAAFDVAAAHLAKRLRRYKRRLRDPLTDGVLALLRPFSSPLSMAKGLLV